MLAQLVRTVISRLPRLVRPTTRLSKSTTPGVGTLARPAFRAYQHLARPATRLITSRIPQRTGVRAHSTFPTNFGPLRQQSKHLQVRLKWYLEDCGCCCAWIMYDVILTTALAGRWGYNMWVWGPDKHERKRKERKYKWDIGLGKRDNPLLLKEPKEYYSRAVF
jgi:hypothetical protein